MTSAPPRGQDPTVLEPFTYPFVQQGLWAVLALSLGAGVLGTFLVLRGLAFFAHGVAAATFPGLVLAAGLGFAAPLGALAVALAFAGGVGRLSTGREDGEHGTTTAMVLVGALAVGVLLASDVFDEGPAINGLLFGSLLLIDGGDLALAVGTSAAVLVAAGLLGGRWLAVGFDRDGARALGVRGGRSDAVLLVLVALVAVATLSAVGSLLAAALMVVPAATVRPWIRRLPTWQLATVLLTALTGVAGLWLSFQTNAPPGATIAVLSGVLFVLSLSVRALRDRRGLRAPVVALAAAALGLGAAGCGGSDGTTADGRLSVVATTTQLGDLAREIGGDAVEVHQVLQANTDPHEYEPRPADVREVAQAKVVLASGDGLDPWVGDLVEQGGGDPTVVEVGERVPTRRPNVSSAEEAEHAHEDEHGHDDEHGHEEDHGHDDETAAGHHHEHEGEFDPHWWHDPENAIAAVAVVRDALVAADPGARERIERSAAAYLATLQRLHREVRACIARVPRDERTLVTSHDAFGYFAQRYGIRVVGAVIPSTTTQAQASAGDVAALGRLVKRERVRAIFPESSVSPKLAEALARQTGATAKLSLYGDTLGPKGSDGATYVGMIQHNARAMVEGFSGGAVRCSFSGS
ncbi:zinc ABC transporter substrate-binding protein [Patulibacter brassicae]|uniref:Zinc ABC transporter substrate-binding protein n=1 Tax=Patulibacter brassicae TaxID=1705717 RepID=A0ABU4VEG3_9ACTN|nr:zinc ABC transporter substrate-binding protein [Patulibacter brassicae]MDX8150175.1 zinc ABC transporter substrate-binding protein [Patulibacter brassicae]